MSWTLITGGAQRLGRAIALALAEKHKDLVIHYRSSEKEAHALAADLRKKGARAEILQGDFSTSQTTRDFLKRYLAQFSDTEALIYTVGDYLLGSPLEIDSAQLSALVHPNCLAALELAQALAPSLKEHTGSITTIGMVGCGQLRANTHAFGYNLTKVALWMLTQSLAKELAPAKVRVNMVSPGYMEESVDLPKEPLPFSRVATHEEVARAVAFLADPASSYITGQNLEVAGGVRLST